jgi:hypothetical protein
MASIELGSLSQYLDDEEIDAITSALRDADIDLDLDDEADGRLLDGTLDDDLLADFLDRLDANGAACDIYLPGDFEEVLDAGGYTIGSTHALMLVLDELQDDLFASDDEEEEEEAAADGEEFDEFDDDDEPQGRYGSHSESVDIQDEQLRALWKLLYKGARTCARDRICLFIHR